MFLKQKLYLKFVAVALAMCTLFTVVPITAWADSTEAVGETAAAAEPVGEPYILAEDETKREAQVKHFRLSDGSYEAVVYPYDVHYASGGSFVAIDNSLVEAENDDYYTNADNAFDVNLPKNLTSGAPIEVTTGGYTVSWALDAMRSNVKISNQKDKATQERNAELSRAKTKNEKNAANDQFLAQDGKAMASATYPGIYDSIDLTYDLVGSELKESIVLKKSTKKASFTFEIDAGGLRAVLLEDNSVAFLDASDNAVLTMQAPYMFDATGATSDEIAVTLKKSGDQYIYTLTPDKHWLKDSARVYPVTIDPTLLPEYRVNTIKDTTASFSARSASNPTQLEAEKAWLKAGRRGNVELASLLYVNLPTSIPASAAIVKASMALCTYRSSISSSSSNMQLNVYKITSDWNQTNIQDNSVLYSDSSPKTPNYDSTVVDFAIFNDAAADTHGKWVEFDITRIVQEWRSGTANRGLMIKANSYPASEQFARFFDSDNGTLNSDPTFCFYYRDTTGLEDYWSYQTQSAGRAGTGYINTYTGNLVFVHSDFAASGLTPFTLQHVYNSNNVMATGDYQNRNSRATYGNGWNLNLVQTLAATSAELTEAGFPFVYTDGDGTQHYFYEKSEGKWVDEDGLGMELTEYQNDAELRKTITFKDGTKYHFDMWTYLRKIVDSNGNTISLNYSPGSSGIDNRLENITYNGKTLSLAYGEQGRLLRVIDPAGRSTYYSYDASNHLTGITYPDGTSVSYTYDVHNLINVVSDIEYSGQGRCKVDYDTNSQKKITKAKEIAGNGTAGNSIENIVYSHNQTVVTDNKGRSITYQFDTNGMVTCAYDSLGNICSQTYDGVFSKKAATQSTTTQYVNNYLYDGCFDSGLELWSRMGDSNAQTPAVVTDKPLIGSKSVKLTSTGKCWNLLVQTPTLSAGTYTYSGYLRTENVVAEQDIWGAGLEVVTTNGRHLYSEILTGTTDPAVNNGYRRVSLTFTLAEGESIVRLTAGLLYATSGTVWLNGLQLEKGETANQVNLLNNSSFERNNGSGAPHGYVFFDNTMSANDTVTQSKGAKDGTWSLRIQGKNGYRHFQKHLNQSGKAGDVYSFGAWAKANSVPRKSVGNFEISIRMDYADGTIEWFNARFNPNVTDWQFTMNNMVAKKDYNKILYTISYPFNANDAYFDSIFLYRDTMQSYVYDSEGNVVSTKDNASQESSFEYKNDNLTKLLEPAGSAYEYLYDSKKNLTFARSGEGVQYRLTYDSVGNPTSTYVGAGPYSTSIQDGHTYYIRLKNTGEYLTVDGAGTANKTNVIEAPFVAGAHQRWTVEKTVDGYYILHPAHATNMSLDVTGAVNTELANVAIYTNNQHDSQKYKIQPQKDFTYTIAPQSSSDGKILTVDQSSTKNNVSIASLRWENNPEQEWYFEDVATPPASQIKDGGVYAIRMRHSGKYVNVQRKGTAPGTVVQQYEFDATDADYLLFRKHGDYYSISPFYAPNLYLEYSDITIDGFKSLKLGDGTLTDRKLFQLNYVADKQGFQIISKAFPTMALDVAYYSTANNAHLIFTGANTNVNRIFLLEECSPSMTSTVTYQDNGNYLDTTTDSRGNTTSYEYNFAKGLQTSVTDANGNETNYTYNASNDQLTGVSSGDTTVSYGYTGDRLTSITHNGFNYGFTYDAFGNRLSTTAGNRTLITNTYAANNGNLTGATYGNGATVGYAYDAYDRVTSISYDNTEAVRYVYDKSGNLYEVQDLENDESVRYSYDLTGRPTEVRSSDGSYLSYAYDTFNRISQTGYGFAGNTANVSYLYGDSKTAGQKTGLIYGVKQNGTQTLSYTYDQLARIQSSKIHTSTPFVTEYTYLEGEGANSTTTLVKTMKLGTDTYGYTYDDLGNITSITKNGTVLESYEYDSLSQLTKVTNSQGVFEYTYDDGGNILSVTKNGEEIKDYTYGDTSWKDLLTQFNGQTITYDNIGNPLSYLGKTLTWENGRQLATINDNISYAYNADGNRISKIVDNVETEYYWLDGVLLGEKTGTNTILYLYDDNGVKYGFDLNGTRYYYVLNLQGDVIGILDSAGTQVVSYTYDAWGNLLSTTGTLADTVGQLNPIRYRGYYYDAETEFYFLNTRYYDPETGRFINADGLVDDRIVNTQNLFQYCANDPINRIDESGLFWKEIGDFFKGIGNSIVKGVKKLGKAIAGSFQIEGGIGYGLGVSTTVGPAKVSATAYQDGLTVGIKNKKSYTAIKGAAGVKADVGKKVSLGISTEYEHRFETDLIRDWDEHTTQSAPWSVYSCPKTIKDPFQFSFPIIKPVEGNLSSGFFVGIGAEAHIGVGGHFTMGWDIVEFWRILTEE